MAEGSMIKTIFIKAAPEQVWAFLTEADKLARWFHEANADLKEGDKYHLLYENPARKGESLLGGEVLEMKKPERLVYTFTHEWLGDVVTTVTWELAALEGGTRLTMTHEGFEQCEDGGYAMLSDHDKGWDEHFVRLRAVANYF